MIAVGSDMVVWTFCVEKAPMTRSFNGKKARNKFVVFMVSKHRFYVHSNLCILAAKTFMFMLCQCWAISQGHTD